MFVRVLKQHSFRFSGLAKGLALLTIISGLFVLSGCAGTMQAIENRNMTLSAKMSDTIFLDPEILANNRNVYVRVTNTSDFQEIDFAELLKGKLSAKGYSLTNNPSQAGYIVQANLLYMGAEKKGLTAEGMLAGGFGAALAGSTIGSGWKGPAAAAAGLGLLGSIGGGIAGSLVHIDTYLGATDIQIKEAVEGGVKGTMDTSAKYGSSTTLKTQREVKSSHQEYRTRIVVLARQTNIDRQEACRAIADRLAAQIAGMF
jgi:hypothetical protein